MVGASNQVFTAFGPRPHRIEPSLRIAKVVSRSLPLGTCRRGESLIAPGVGLARATRLFQRYESSTKQVPARLPVARAAPSQKVGTIVLRTS